MPVGAVALFGAVEEAYTLPLAALALLLGGATLVRRAWLGERPLPLPAITLPVLALAAIPALQLLPLPDGLSALMAPGLARTGATPPPTISVEPYQTSLALVRWLAYSAFLIAALDALARPGALTAALGAVALLGFAEALYGIGNLMLGNAGLLWLPRAAYFADATGTLVNRNHFATVLVLALAALLARHWLVAGRLAIGREPGPTAILFAGAVPMGLGVLLSHSRAGIGSLCVGWLAITMLTPRSREGRRARWILAALAAVVLGYAAHSGLDPVVERFAELPGDLDARDGGRPALWRDTADLVRDFPVLGAGAGTFETVFPAYARRTVTQLLYSHAHQDYLQIAAEGGLVALALVAAALIAFAWTVGSGIARRHGRTRVALAALTAGVGAALLHACVDFPLHIPGVAFLVILMGAAALTLATSEAA